MNNQYKAALAFASFCTLVGTVFAQEAITRDPASGDYLITYQEQDANGNVRLVQKTFIPKTKIAPSVSSSFKWSGKGPISYAYGVTNGSTAKQDIHMIIIDPVRSILSSQIVPHSSPNGMADIKLASRSMSNAAKELQTPSSWYPSMAFSKFGSGARLGWTHTSVGGIPPGESQKHFGYDSPDLPGIVMAAVSGSAPPGQGLGENAPDADTAFGKQYKELTSRNFVPVAVAAPAISIAPPAKQSDVLRAVQLHVRTWPSLNVMDQGLASKIDVALEQAVTALAANKKDDAQVALKSARKLLKQHFGDVDSESGESAQSKSGKDANSKLAGRVLTFNLRYVSKTLNNGQDVAE